MMPLFKFEIGYYFRKPLFYVSALFILLLGFLIGYKATMSAGPEIYKNSPFVLYQMIGLLSLLGILFTTLLGSQIIFKEKDANFYLILYSTPLKKINYLSSRLLAIFLLSAILFSLLITGMMIGHQQSPARDQFQTLYLPFYIQPLILLGYINILFCTAVVGAVGWLGKNKLLVFVSGLILYMSYMAALIFSGSPMMAGATPQSDLTMLVSALFDPFGVSAFYHQTIHWSIIERNNQLLSFSGVFLVNRLAILIISASIIVFIFWRFTFSMNLSDQKKKIENGPTTTPNLSLKFVQPIFDYRFSLQSFFSIVRLDLIYIIKSIPFLLISLALLFYLSMEMYAMIEKGIRLPQQYASSGLMAQAISENFHTLCLLVVLFYANDLFRRSKTCRFNMITDATPLHFSTFFFGKWASISVIIILLTTLINLLGITFQLLYHYPYIDWYVYLGIYWGISFPLIVSTSIILCVEKIIRNRFLALIVSSVLMLVTATSIGRSLGIKHPLLNFQLAFSERYSDFSGWDLYFSSFSMRMLFAIAVVGILVMIVLFSFRRMNTWTKLGIGFLFSIVVSTGYFIANRYQPSNKSALVENQVNYEKQFRYLQQLPQPTVTHIRTHVDLMPLRNCYTIDAIYTLENKTGFPVYQVLINFDSTLVLKNASWISHNQLITITSAISIVKLKQPLLPGDTAKMKFELAYKWDGYNKHHPVNAIIKNGAFMRISNYYPRIGYQSEYELSDGVLRKQYALSAITPVTKLEAPRKSVDDFIMLDMTVSTDPEQTAIGVGMLVKQWKTKERSYFQYKTISPIPFRFAISSANYSIKKAMHKGKIIEVYYHPKHSENVNHLIQHAKHTIDYCEKEFTPYPYEIIRFAEISSFTKGFVATAYPTVIYMTEQMLFHANINADQKQDVINELAGHELSHQWWGNAQLAPDFEREGSTVLTETLAMYTEFMLAKKMYGKKRLLELVRLHHGIYMGERGYLMETSLAKYQNGNPAVVYNKGAVVLYQLSEMIGEANLNLALRNLLQKHAYPGPVPLASDLVNELVNIAGKKYAASIFDMFYNICFTEVNLKSPRVNHQENRYEVSFSLEANKVYEDGQGNKVKKTYTDTVEVMVTLKNGHKKLFVLTLNNVGLFTLSLPEQPVSIQLDPFYKLMHYNLPNDIAL